MNALPGDSRKTTAATRSSGVPKRPMGMRANALARVRSSSRIRRRQRCGRHRGTNGVDADTTHRPFHGQNSRQVRDGGLACGISSVVGIGHGAGDRRQRDDAARSLLRHDAPGRAGQAECPRHVDVDRALPLGIRKVQGGRDPVDAAGVDHAVEASPVLHRGADGTRARRPIHDVEGDAGGHSSRCRKVTGEIVRPARVDVRDDDACTPLAQRARQRRPETAGASRHHDRLTFDAEKRISSALHMTLPVALVAPPSLRPIFQPARLDRVDARGAWPQHASARPA